MRFLWKRQVKRTMLSKLNFAGTGSVFRFTLTELLKAKANIVSIIFIVVFALAFPPVSAIINGSTAKNIREMTQTETGYTDTVPGLTDEQTELLSSGFSTYVQPASEYFSEEEEGADFDERYFLQLAYAIIIIMVSIMSSTYIIRSVVEEKSSKLVEFMLISVRPLALLAGKILSVLVYVTGMLLLMFGAYRLSETVTGRFMDLSASNSAFSMLSRIFALSPSELVVIVISAVLGILTFAILSGICGAGCSSAEDVNGATTMPMLIIMFCYVIALMVSGIDREGINIFCSLCPVISVFCAPVQFMLGNIGVPMLIAAWALQCAIILLLLILTARIYSDLLIYRGSRLKFGGILKMAFGRRGGKQA